MTEDMRVPGSTRCRAQALLDKMCPAQIVSAGLFADYTVEALRFVRAWDEGDHDIAKSTRERDASIKRMRVLFYDLHILCEVPAGTDGETFTSIAMSRQSQWGRCTSMIVVSTCGQMGQNKLQCKQ